MKLNIPSDITISELQELVTFMRMKVIAYNKNELYLEWVLTKHEPINEQEWHVGVKNG